MHYLYIIKSIQKEWHYIGISDNPHKRILAHNAGTTKSTKPHRPFKLIYIEECGDIKKAREREIYLKRTAKAREQLYKEYGHGAIV